MTLKSWSTQFIFFRHPSNEKENCYVFCVCSNRRARLLNFYLVLIGPQQYNTCIELNVNILWV